jgi:flagellar motor switch protein FliG
MQKVRGVHKAAAILGHLDSEAAANVLRNMDVAAVARLGRALFGAEKPQVAQDGRLAALKEFSEALGPRAGGRPAQTFEQALHLAFGEKRGKELLSEVSRREAPLDQAAALPADALAAALRDEDPRAIAPLVSRLDARKAGALLGALPAEAQTGVVARIVSCDSPRPEVLDLIAAQAVKRGAELLQSGGVSEEDRYRRAVAILKAGPREVRKTALEGLDAVDPEAAQRIREMLIVFDDILSVEDHCLQNMLRQVDTKTLALALKNQPEPLVDKVLNNVSRGARATVKEEQEFMGSVTPEKVEEAQQGILTALREMDERGELVMIEEDSDASAA